jgi:hypothetical protein
MPRAPGYHSGCVASSLVGVIMRWQPARAGAVAPTAPDQRSALVELYIATNGTVGDSGWQNHSTGSDPCDDSWRGVNCSGSVGSINRDV